MLKKNIPSRTRRCFSSNKPWINSEIMALLKEKKRAFTSRNKEELKATQRELRRKIRGLKKNYRWRMEEQLLRNNTARVRTFGI